MQGTKLCMVFDGRVKGKGTERTLAFKDRNDSPCLPGKAFTKECGAWKDLRGGVGKGGSQGEKPSFWNLQLTTLLKATAKTSKT